jgi:hypothetical protein
MLNFLRRFVHRHDYKRTKMTPARALFSDRGGASGFEVAALETIDARPAILQSHIDFPAAGYKTDTHHLEIGGWVFGAQSPVAHVAVYDYQGVEIQRTPCNLARPDGARFVPSAVHQPGGFWLPLSILANQCEVRYTLVAILADGSFAPFTQMTIKAGRFSAFQPALSPLLLTSLGRTGSTWVMGILAQHPEIIAVNPEGHDVRAASYWASVAAGLAQPKSYMQIVSPSNMDADGWWLGGPLSPDVAAPDDALLRFMHGAGVESVTDFCLKQIESFYQHLQSVEGRDPPRYYVEKHDPRLGRVTLRNLCPDAREVVLIRDPRDVICSALAFNKKRGFEGFGRQAVTSDEEYVRWFKGSIALLLNLLDSPTRPIHLLRYEELVQRPEETLRALFTYLQVDASDATIAHVLKEPSKRLLREHRTTKTPEASVGRWHTDLTPGMRAAARETLDPILLKLGYPATT